LAITTNDCIERIVSTLEAQTSGTGERMFEKVRTAMYPIVKQIEFDLCTGTSGSGTSGAAQPLPQTLASFVWYLPTCQNTPISQPYTYPVLRPIASGCLIEAFVEVGTAASGGSVLFEFYKNNTKICEATLVAGHTNITVPVPGTLASREFSRDDFFAFKITEAVTLRARFLTVYLRFFQYPYVMGDAQSPLPVPT
jgi:hypothetical protein